METEWHNYIGTKTVRAAKMSAEKAQRAGANITDEVVRDNFGKEGYVIDYPDGYRSWCPAEAFAYKKADNYIEHMEIEFEELGGRILSTAGMLYAGALHLTDSERSSLKLQFDTMRIYSECLFNRIAAAKEKQQLKNRQHGNVD